MEMLDCVSLNPCVMCFFVFLCFIYLKLNYLFELNLLCYVLQDNPLNNMKKILDCEMLPAIVDDPNESKPLSKKIFVKQYSIRWKGFSYLHCTW